MECNIAGNSGRQEIGRGRVVTGGTQCLRNLCGDARIKKGTRRIGDQSQNIAHRKILQDTRKMAALKPAVIIAGPTASGKTACALALATEFNGMIVNADAQQLYRELSILTDRPRPPQLALAPHRLFGVLAASDPCSAGRWRELALAEMNAASDAGRLPILVGGTGLYLKALMSGLSSIPSVPPEIRGEATELYERLGHEQFQAELARLDPGMSDMPRDKQRLIRAYEVIAATGKPLRFWQQPAGEDAAAPFKFAVLLFDPPRDALYAAIERRFDRMMERGALDEAEKILALNLDPSLPAMKAVGLKELISHLKGELSLADAIIKAKQSSRNYAKRQVTWFRHQLPHQPSGARRFPAQFSESLEREIFSFIRHCC